jgi:ABC-type glycerol-3-phosphate transport system substrate-binding protein
MNQSTQGNFQKIFVIGGFILGVLGIFVFSISQFGKNNVDPALTGNILVWGTLPADKMNQIFYEYSQNAKTYSVTYEELPEDKLALRFLERAANENAPDILLVPENVSFPLVHFLYNFQENLISEKTFKETYIRSTFKFFAPTGVFAFPVAIDPLVMYVNTDILTNAAFTKPPETWGEIPLYVSRVIGFTNSDGNNVQRAIALGTIDNVLHSREILLTLLMQLKNNVIERTFEEKQDKDGTFFLDKYESVFGIANEELKIKNDLLAEQVFVFFTSFVNPNIKEAYTWSKKAPLDRDLFASGNLGLYFGLASDKGYIDSKNPHLSYELAMVPGPKGDTANFRNTSYAKIYAVSLTTKTKKPELAQKVMNDILAKDISGKIVDAYKLAPARQDELYKTIVDEKNNIVAKEVDQNSLNKNIVYKSADRGDIITEPRLNMTSIIFAQIVDSFSGSRQTPSEIIKNAESELVRQLK